MQQTSLPLDVFAVFFLAFEVHHDDSLLETRWIAHDSLLMYWKLVKLWKVAHGEQKSPSFAREQVDPAKKKFSYQLLSG